MDKLRADAARAKQDAVPPKHVVSSRRAEVKKRAAFLAVAHQQLERHTALLAEMQEVAASEAAEYKRAEDELEAAQRRMAECVAPSQDAAAPVPAADAPCLVSKSLALSPQSAQALEGLRAHLAELGSAMAIAEAEAAHKAAVDTANADGQVPPSILAFVMQLLGARGLEQLEIVRFDMSKDARCPEGAAPQTHAPSPCPGARAMRLSEDAGARSPRRTSVKAPPTTGAMAAAGFTKRAAAQAEIRAASRNAAPSKDPLWAVMRTAGGA